MPDWLLWITDHANSKIVALLLFFVSFCGILIYVYTGRERSSRLESYKYMPLQDDESDLNAAGGEEETHESDKS